MADLVVDTDCITTIKVESGNPGTGVPEGFQVFLRDVLGVLLEGRHVRSNELETVLGETVVVGFKSLVVSVLRHRNVLLWLIDEMIW